MAFPLSFNGGVLVGVTGEASEAAEALAQGLRALEVREVSRSENDVRFTAGLKFVSNWINMISSGSISVEPTPRGLSVQYTLRFDQAFWLVVLMVSITAAPMAILALGVVQGLMLTVFFWAWMFGGSVVVATYKFPRWIEHIVRGDTA